MGGCRVGKGRSRWLGSPKRVVFVSAGAVARGRAKVAARCIMAAAKLHIITRPNHVPENAGGPTIMLTKPN